VKYKRKIKFGWILFGIWILCSGVLRANAGISLFVMELENPLLTLVNWEHPLEEGWTVNLVEIEEGYQVDRRMYEDLRAMLADMRSQGLYPRICSAYRDYDMQNQLHEREVEAFRYQGLSEEEARNQARLWVAVPGTSEHQMGLAVDILDEGWMEMDESQENTEVQKWLMAHCADYGFILRYPVGKTELTGIGYEPWHYRYVGKGTARLIMDSGLCMEEYLEMMRGIKVEIPQVFQKRKI